MDDLIKRLQDGEGNDRLLDDHIAERFNDWNRSGSFRNSPLYTTNLDACIALAEKVFPGWRWYATNKGYVEGVYQGGKTLVRIDDVISSGGGPYWTGIHMSISRAFLIAILKAKETT